jgi:hypothetical protein
MSSYTAQLFDAVARKKFPEDYAATPRANTLLFVGQYYVSHDKASGVKLRVGVLFDKDGGKEMVWALVVFAEGVLFYKESGVWLSAALLKQVRFDEPMRTLVGSFKDHRASILRSHILAWFMDKGALEEFQEDKVISFKHFKSGCKKIAAEKRKGRYDVRNSGKPWEVVEGDEETDDEGYESEGDGVHDGQGEEGETP